MTGHMIGEKELIEAIEHVEAEALRRWIVHLIGVEVGIEPLTELREAKFTWYVGLDQDGSRIGDTLWNGDELDEAFTTAAADALLGQLTARGRGEVSAAQLLRQSQQIAASS